MENWYAALPVVVLAAMSAILNWQVSKRYLHFCQLSSYQLDGYFGAVRRGFRTEVAPVVAMCAAIAGICLLIWRMGAMLFAPVPWLSLLLASAAGAVALYFAVQRQMQKIAPAKKPFVKTPRAARLIGANTVLQLGISLVCGIGFAVMCCTLIVSIASPWKEAVLFCLWFLVQFPLWGAPWIVALATALRKRPEEKINHGFVEDAKRILAQRSDLLRIGITGSYGKTSTKFILGTILAEKYRVLVPPQSYNTPMGVTRVIREQLLPEHEIMICEMGARRTGEIRELCEIVHPQYGILTSIGPQHLETFGSIEMVAKTKYELMQALPEDGWGFFPQDGSYAQQCYEQFEGKKGMFGFEGEGLYAKAEDLEVSAFGSAFTLVFSPQEKIRCQTALLGKHNIQNILGCACVAHALGLTLEQICEGIRKAQPVEHRLQLIRSGNGALVIDDAFNSSPNGTKAAMEVLSMFEGYRKICITPGLVELGEKEAEENHAFGVRLAKVCDIVILVGKKHTEPIRNALEENGLREPFLFSADSLAEATEILGYLVSPGDVILFENDLPDQYNE